MDSIKISNFRKIKESWEFDLAPITFFTGKNNSGKSSALKALMVFSDYTNSSNHFELDFLGVNSGSHKIESYSNCINWKNNAKSNIAFEYKKCGYSFASEFSPNFLKNDSDFQYGMLEALIVTNDRDNSKIELKRKSKESYELHFNSRFLEKNVEAKVTIQTARLIKTKEKIEQEIEKTKLEIKKKLGIELGASLTSGVLIGALSFTPVGWLGAAGAAITGYLTNKKLNDVDDKTKITLKSKLEKLTEDLKVIDKKLEKSNVEKVKLDQELIFTPSFDLNKLFLNDTSITNILKRVLVPYLQDTIKKYGNIDIKDETIKLDAFSNEFLDLFQFEVDHLSPHRYDQERLILNEGTSDDLSKIAKNQIKKGIKKGSDADEFIKKWMNEFDIGIDYEIISVYGQASIINVYEDGIKKPINIADKGFGAGQIFTILLKIAEKIDNHKIDIRKNYYLPLSGLEQIVIIEEPEANLHPGLQSKLTEMFLDAYSRFKIRFVIETHSEYMIRKSQLLNLDNKVFKLYYFDENEPYEMVYNDHGKFDRDFGAGFYDEAGSLTLKMIKEQRKRQSS